jgi:hypothetical protein
MSENDRQQRMIERVQEDERLRGDLPDEAATVLVEWASQRVAAAAADPARPDADVEAEVVAIRAAARSAARGGEADPQRVIALAEAALAQPASTVPRAAASTTPPPPAPQPAQPAPTAGADTPPSTIEQAQPAPKQTEATERPKQHRVSFWRRWSPFAKIWNRFRGER